MLYTQLRYVEEVQKMYRLRHLLASRHHPDIGSRLGYPKYSKQFYRITKKLSTEGILDRQGRFVENLPNRWLAEIPFDEKEKISMLGNRVPYTVYLALCLDPPKKAGGLAAELFLNRMSVHLAVAKMEREGLVKVEDSIILPIDGSIRRWFLRYLDLCKTYCDATGEITPLFNAVPAYIGGLHAYYMTHYEPGRPVGPADMIIVTARPFRKFWESAAREVGYFRDYPKKIEFAEPKPSDKVVWQSEIPYKKSSQRQ